MKPAIARAVPTGCSTIFRWPAPAIFTSCPLALDRPENQIPQPGGHLRAPQPLGNTKSSPNCFKETCFKERCQALSPLAPLPVTPGQHLDHLGCSSSLRQTTGPRPRAVRGQQQGLNTPPSGRESCYSSLPSKHTKHAFKHALGFKLDFVQPQPIIPATPGRTQPTPSASRSVGAELAGVAISIFAIRFTSFQ